MMLTRIHLTRYGERVGPTHRVKEAEWNEGKEKKKKWGGNIAVMSFDALIYREPVRPTRHPRLLLSPKGSCNPAHFGPHPFFSFFQIGQRPNTIDITKGNWKKRGKMMSKSHFFFGGVARRASRVQNIQYHGYNIGFLKYKKALAKWEPCK